MKFTIAALLASAAALPASHAQDPASGWMAYAVGDISATGAERITKLEMTWTVGAEPKSSSAFFSPWFGMDPADNLNLIQPVNPWSSSFRGGNWAAYTEYYQWSPTHNSNSKSFNIKSGDTLKGSLEYNAADDSYTLTQTCVETGDVSTQVVAAQNGKKYTVPYVVYEKTFPCGDYPPDEVVTFRDIVMECDGKDCVDDVAWTVDVKDDNCNMAASVSDDQRSISITWDTTLSSKYDDFSRAQLHDLNMRGNWATQLQIERPTDDLLDFKPDPVHPIKCAADVAALAKDASTIATTVAAVTSTCDKTHSDECVQSLNGFLSTIDTTLIDAETAFADCSDGTDSECNEDVSAILAILADTSKDLEADLADCVHVGVKTIKQCVVDVVATGEVAVAVVKDAVKALKECKSGSRATLELPTPVHPIKCAADVAKIAEQVPVIKSGIDAITGSCDKSHNDACITALTGFTVTVDQTLDMATTAFGDCSDGTDSECNQDVAAILAVLEDASDDVKADLDDCVKVKMGGYKQCVTDVVQSGEKLVEVAEDVFGAIKACKGDSLFL